MNKYNPFKPKMSALSEDTTHSSAADEPGQPIIANSATPHVTDTKPKSKNRRLSVAIRSIAAESGVASLVGLAEKPIEQRGLSMSQEIKVRVQISINFIGLCQ